MPKKIRLSYDILAMRAIETESGVNIDDALRRIHAYEVVDGTGDNNHPDVRPGKESTKILYIVRTRGELDWKYAEWIWYKDGSVEKWVCVGGTTSPDDSWKRWSEARNSIATGDNSVYVGSDNTIERNDGYAFGTRNTIRVTDDKDYTGSEAVSIGRDNVSINSIDSYNFGHDNEVSGGNPDDIDNKLAMNLGAGNKVVREGVNIGKENASDTFGITIGQKNNSHNASIVLGENNVANRSSIAMGKRSAEMPFDSTYPAMLIDGKYYPVVKSGVPSTTWVRTEKAGFDNEGNLVNLWETTGGKTGHIAHINTRSRKAFFVALNSGEPIRNGQFVYGYTDDNGNFVEASTAPDPDHPIEQYYRIVHNGVTFVGTTSYSPDPMDDQKSGTNRFAYAAYFCVPNPAIQIDVAYDIDYLVEQTLWFPAVYRCGDYLGRDAYEQFSTIWLNSEENRAVRYKGSFTTSAIYSPNPTVAVTGFDKDGVFYPYNGHNNGDSEVYEKQVDSSDIVMHKYDKSEYAELGIKPLEELATWIPAGENSIAIGDAQTVCNKSVGITAACARLPWNTVSSANGSFADLTVSGESEPYDQIVAVAHDHLESWPTEETTITVDTVESGSIGLLVEQYGPQTKHNTITEGSIGIGDQNTVSGASVVVGSNSLAETHSYVFGADSLSARGKSIAIGRDGPIAASGSLAIGMSGGYSNCGSLIFGYSGVTAEYGSLTIGYQGATATYGSILIGSLGAYATYGSYGIGQGLSASYGSYGFGHGTYSYQGAFAIGRYARATYGGMTISTGNTSPTTGRAAFGGIVRYRNPDGYYAPITGSIQPKSGYTITHVRVLPNVWYNDVQYDYAVVGTCRTSDGYFDYASNVNLYRNGVLAGSAGKTNIRMSFQNGSRDMWMVSDGSTYTFIDFVPDQSCTYETANLYNLRDYMEVSCRTFIRDGQTYVYANYNGYPDTDLEYRSIALNLCSFDVYSSWTCDELGYSSESWDKLTTLGGYASGIAIGRLAHAEGSSIAIGLNESYNSGGNSVGITNAVYRRGDKLPTSIGYRIYDNYTTANGYSFAAGQNVHAEGQSIAFGRSVQSYGYSLVFGRNGACADNYSMSIGQNTNTAKDYAFAIGENGNYASGYAFAIGTSSNSAVGYSMAVGRDSNSAVDYSTAFGAGNRAEMYSTVFGYYSKGTGYSFVTGKSCFAFDYSCALGANSQAYNNAISVGDGATAYEASMTFGRNSTAYHRSIVFGENSTGDGNSLVVGQGNSAANQSVAIGFENYMSGSNSEYGALLGHSNSMLQGGYNVGAGKANSLSREAIAIGVGNSVHGWSIGIGTGNSSTVSGGGHATMIGYRNTSKSDQEYLTFQASYTKGTSYYLPINTYYCYTYSQQIYTPQDLGSASGGITEISFYNTGSNQYTRSIEIFLVNTTKDTFTSSTDWIIPSSSDMVYSGSYSCVAGWNTIQLSRTFYYESGKNLAVILRDKTGSYQGSIYWETISGERDCTLSIYSDGTNYNPYSPSSNSGSVETAKNSMRIKIDGETVEYPVKELSGQVATNSFIVGVENESRHYNSILVGLGNVSLAPGQITGDDGLCMAIGRENHVTRNYDIAIGYKSTADGGENLAVHKSYARGFRNTAIDYSIIDAGIANFAMNESILTMPAVPDDNCGIMANGNNTYNVLHHAELISNHTMGNGMSENTLFNASVTTGNTCSQFNDNILFNMRKPSYSAAPELTVNCETFTENIVIGYKSGSRVSTFNPIVFGGSSSAANRNVLLYNAYKAYTAGGNNTVDNLVMMSDLDVGTNAGFNNNLIAHSWIDVNHGGAYLIDSVVLGRSHVHFRDSSGANMSNFLFGSFLGDTSIQAPSMINPSTPNMMNVLFNSTAINTYASFSYGEYNTAPFNNGGFIPGGSTETTLVDCRQVYNFGDLRATSVANSFMAGMVNTVDNAQRCSIIGHQNTISVPEQDSESSISYQCTSSINIIGTENVVYNHITPEEASNMHDRDVSLDKMFIFGYNNTVDARFFVTDNIIMGSENHIAGEAANVVTLTSTQVPTWTTPGMYTVATDTIYPTSDTITSIYNSYYYLYSNGCLAEGSYDFVPEQYSSISTNNLVSGVRSGTLTEGTWYKPSTYLGSISIPSGTTMLHGNNYAFNGTEFELVPIDVENTHARYTMHNVLIGRHNTVLNNIVGFTAIGSDNVISSNSVGKLCISNGFVQGNNNSVSDGSNIITMGNGNVSTGHNSVAIGSQLISNQWQTVIGKYNSPIAGPNRLDTEDPQDPSKALFIIGNGYSATDGEDWQDETYITRSNAMEVYADGTVKANSFVTDTDLTLTAGSGISITEDSTLHTVTIGLDTELQQVLASHPGADGKRYTLECNNGQLGWVEVGVATV